MRLNAEATCDYHRNFEADRVFSLVLVGISLYLRFSIRLLISVSVSLWVSFYCDVGSFPRSQLNISHISRPISCQPRFSIKFKKMLVPEIIFKVMSGFRCRCRRRCRRCCRCRCCRCRCRCRRRRRQKIRILLIFVSIDRKIVSSATFSDQVSDFGDSNQKRFFCDQILM